MTRKANASLASLLSPAKLRGYGWNRSFERGESYHRSGAVTSLVQEGNRISAVVAGTHAYKTAIWLEQSDLRFTCTCPVDGFCKHLIATALAWNNGEAELLDDLDPSFAPTDAPTAKGKKTKQPDVRSYLLTLDKEQLVEMLLKQAAADKTLREKLRLATTVSNPDGVDLSSMRKRIDAALKPPARFGYDDEYYYEEGDSEYARQLEPVLDALRSMLPAGAASVVTLAEHALKELTRQCRDMDYESLDVEDMTEALATLHVEACSLAAPEPTALADWLFRNGIKEAIAAISWRKYRPVLGAEGMARFRALAETEWESLPKGAMDFSNPKWYLRSRIQEIILAFAERDGDIDAQAAIIKSDLSSQHAYLELAQLYRSAKRYDDALAWAEKGWQAFSDRYRHSGDLRDFLAKEYRRNNMNDRALNLYWAEFADFPTLHSYQLLKKECNKEKAWPEQRQRALQYIRDAIAAAQKDKAKNKPARSDATHSLLVEIFLWEEKTEDAWAEATAGGCREDLWLALSKRREKEHPEDCLPIWRKRVQRLTRNAHQSDYPLAAESLVKLGDLMTRTGQRAEFLSFMEQMRHDLKRRRTFIQMLDKYKLP